MTGCIVYIKGSLYMVCKHSVKLEFSENLQKQLCRICYLKLWFFLINFFTIAISESWFADQSAGIVIVEKLRIWFKITFFTQKFADYQKIFFKFQFYTEFADHVKTPWIPNYLKCKLLCSFNSNCTFLVHIRPLWEPF